MYERNGVIYQRDVDHCEPSRYVKLVTIQTVTPAVNSDKLDAITFKEMGWCTVYKRGVYKPGDKVMFIPAESVLPFELSEKLGVTKYLSSGRLRVTRLRGNRSEGIIENSDTIYPYIGDIMQWEDRPILSMGGKQLPEYLIHPYFNKFYKMPNILNEPYLFRPGEKIFYSEKVHGCNARFAKLKGIKSGEYMSYVGSHNRVLEESDDNLYWNVYNEKLEDKIPEDIEFFGEIFGKGVQDLHYDSETPNVLIFAATLKGYYMSPTVLQICCEKHDLPCIKFHMDRFVSVERFRTIANTPSEYTKNHIREGIVIVSADRPERMAKCKGDQYMERSKKLERR